MIPEALRENRNTHTYSWLRKKKQDTFDPYEIVPRIAETEGKVEEVIVKLPHKPKEVLACDHLERPIEAITVLALEEDQFIFKIQHDQIRTFLVRFN